MKENKNLIIVFLLLFIIGLLGLLGVRYNNNHSPKVLTCYKETDNSKENLIFRFNMYSELYNYEKELKLFNLNETDLNNEYSKYNHEYERIKDSLSDNFKYEVNRYEDTIMVKTYINVLIYNNYYNQYINDEHIKSDSKIDDIKSYLEENNYTCNIRKK